MRFLSSSSSLPIAIAIAAAMVIGHPAPTHTATSAPAARDAADDLAKLLAGPLTPGSVGLLVEHVSQQAAQKRLIEAVKHEDPAVRAVAARVAFTTESRGLVPPLIATLAKEQHVHTAVEQIRALSTMLGAPGDNVVMRHVERLGGPAATAMAETLARTRPADLIKHLPALLDAGEPGPLGGPLSAAAVQHPSAANEILHAVLATKSSDLWEALLDSAYANTDVAIPSAVLVQALQSSEERVRTHVVWHLFEAVHNGDPASEEALAAAAPKPVAATAAAADLTWEDFSREMLARARRKPPTKADWAGLIALEEHRAHVRVASNELYAYLTPAELKAISAIREFERPQEQRRYARSTRRAISGDGRTRSHVMRTIPVFATGLIGDLLAVTGCRPPNEQHFAAGEVTYRPEGGPMKIALTRTMKLSEECDRFVSTMMKLSIALPERPITPDTADYIVLLFNKQYLACADDPFPPVRPRFSPNSRIVAPQRKRGADIQYPRAALRQQLDGLVVLGIRITHTGCIASAETIRSVNPLFDLAAIQGVFTAQYTPALIDGQPVETHMTYTVNFRP